RFYGATRHYHSFPTRRSSDLFEKYKEVSRQIRDIFFEYTDLVEPLSLDEAYLDVTENKKGIATATRIAREIRQRIWEETQLSASDRKSTRLNSSHVKISYAVF